MEDLIKFVQGLIPERSRPFVNALLAAVAVILALVKLLQPMIAMRHGRRRNAIALERLDEAIKTTTFWDGWLKAHQEVNAPEQVELARGRVRAELDRVLETLAVPSAREEHEERGAQHSFARRLFLLYKPEGWLAWIFHLAFYVSLVFGFFYLLGMFVDPATNDLSWTYFWTNLNETLAPSLIFILPLLLFHWGARWQRRRRAISA